MRFIPKLNNSLNFKTHKIIKSFIFEGPERIKFIRDVKLNRLVLYILKFKDLFDF